MTAGMDARVAVVLKGWPRLSETFIAQEIAGLEARGLAIEIWSLRKPTDGWFARTIDRSISLAISSAQGWEGLLGKYDIHHALLPKKSAKMLQEPLRQALASSPAWSLARAWRSC